MTDQDQLRTIFNGLGAGVVAVGEQGDILWVNGFAADLLDLDDAQTSGRLELGGAQGAIARLLARVLHGDEPEPSAELRVRQAGTPRIISLSAKRLTDGDGAPGGAVCVLNDVTELRRLERVRQDFIANVSHELKTPVTAIQGFTETLLDDGQMPPETRQRFLQRVKAQTDRLSALVHDLITISRLEVGEELSDVMPLDVRQPVQESLRVLSPTAEARGIRVEDVFHEAPLIVLADSEALRQVADNLIDNAIKYTRPRGLVSVSVFPENGLAVLQVRDTGVGIPRDHLGRIFERFYRVDKARSRALGGTGLGLSIVKHRVQSLGGQVTVESRPDAGSTFRVHLPLISR